MLQYYGMDQTTKKWGVQDTYGGKLTENCVQAIARDCLAVNIRRLESAGYPVVFHVHDEVVIEMDPQEGALDDVTEIMSQPIAWAPGLPLNQRAGQEITLRRIKRREVWITHLKDT